MPCDTILHNLKLIFNLCWRNIKYKLYFGVKWTNLHSLGGKLNQIIIQGVIQTFAIVEGSKLNFFQKKRCETSSCFKLYLKSQLNHQKTKIYYIEKAKFRSPPKQDLDELDGYSGYTRMPYKYACSISYSIYFNFTLP